MDDILRITMAIKKGMLFSPQGFIICPYGNLGKKTKQILNEEFGVDKMYIFDQSMEKKPTEIDSSLTYVVLISTTKSNIRKYYIEQFKGFDNSVIIDIFDDYSITDNCFSELKGIQNGFDKNTMTYQMKSHDVKFYLPLYNKDIIQKHIVRYDEFKDEDQLYWVTSCFQNGIIGERIKSGCILDIGSNIGNHSLYFSKVCRANRILAFEPIRYTYDILMRNIQINKLDSVICAINSAVGSTSGNGMAADGVDYSNTGGTRIIESANNSGNTFRIIKLDEMKFEQDITLMKIDVEGFEKDVISGAIETIKSNHPYIMIESWDSDNNIIDIMTILMKYDYRWIQTSICDYLFF